MSKDIDNMTTNQIVEYLIARRDRQLTTVDESLLGLLEFHIGVALSEMSGQEGVSELFDEYEFQFADWEPMDLQGLDDDDR